MLIVCLCLTWVLQHVQFFTESIIVVLQLSLLLLHVLHVLCERANLRLMLLTHMHKDAKLLTCTTRHLRASERLMSYIGLQIAGLMKMKPHLWDEQLAGGQLSAGFLHLAMALQLHVLQLPAALHHRLHLRLDLTDVQPRHGELLLDRTADLHRLHTHRHRDYRDTQLQLKESELL